MTEFGWPKYTRQASTGETGLLAVTKLFLSEFGWLLRRTHQEHDFGVDGHVDIVTGEGRVTGRSFAVQIKHGVSYFDHATERAFLFRGALKHLNYYSNYPLPIVLILSHPDTHECYWARFDPLRTSRAGDDWVMPIPKQNRLTAASRNALEAIAGIAHDYSKDLETYWRENELLSKGGLIIVGIAREEIEAGDVSWFAAVVDRLQVTDELIRATQGKLEFWVAGYDSDTRELWEIPEVCAWMRLADVQVKYWFYFCNTGTPLQALRVLAACTCGPKRLDDTSLELDEGLYENWLTTHFCWLNEVTDRLCLPLKENKRISFAVLKALDPSFEPPADD